MATTRQMVDWILMNANGWDRDGVRGILPILNEVHRILFQQETEQTLKFDSVTGDFPFIPTIAGVYKYELPSDVWRVSEVLLPFPLNPDYGFRNLLPDYNYIKHERQVDTKIYFHKRYAKLPNVTALDKTSSANAMIRFHDDPGDKIDSVQEGTNTTATANKLIDSSATFVTNKVLVGHGVTNNTDGTIAVVESIDSETQLTLDRNIFTATGKEYKVGGGTMMYRGYIEPKQLVSESVQMDGSPDTHLNIILPATEAAIAAFENGGWPQAIAVINQFKEEMMQSQSAGDQGLTYRTERSEE